MKKNYLSRKEIETIEIDEQMSPEQAKELQLKLSRGVIKYSDKLELVKDIPLTATVGLTVLGFSNTVIDAINHFTGATPTAPNGALATATFAAGAASLFLMSYTFKKCNEKLKKLIQVAAPKVDKLEEIASKNIEEVEDEIS